MRTRCAAVVVLSLAALLSPLRGDVIDIELRTNLVPDDVATPVWFSAFVNGRQLGTSGVMYTTPGGAGSGYASIFYSNPEADGGKYSFVVSPSIGVNYWAEPVDVIGTLSGIIGPEAFTHSAIPAGEPHIVPGSLYLGGVIDMQGGIFNMGMNPLNPDEPAFSLQIDATGLTQRNRAVSPDAAWVWDFQNHWATMKFERGTDGQHRLMVNGREVITTSGEAKPVRLAIGSGNASGLNTFSSGMNTTASGWMSFAAGRDSTASGFQSAAFGRGTISQGENQFAVGQYNLLSNGTAPTSNIFIVGNGSGASARSNAFAVARNGDVRIAGTLMTGSQSTATSDAVAALGDGAIANGQGSMALGDGANGLGVAAIAIGQNSLAQANESSAFGNQAKAYAWESTALGHYSSANAHSSTALGAYATASGDRSIAIGPGSQAQGPEAAAIGLHSRANGYGQIVVGVLNDPTVYTSSSPEDLESSVFVVANGRAVEGQEIRSNAITVKRSGETSINGSLNVSGVIRVPPAGDLSMGDFAAGDPPAN